MSDPIRLLFVDDEPDFIDFMTLRLRRHDIEVAAFTDPCEVLPATEGRTFDVVWMQRMLADEEEGS